MQVNKNECINLFNNINNGVPVSFKDIVLPFLSEYLTEINLKDSDKIISLIIQKPNLAKNIIAEAMEYYLRKYCIFSISFNNKILLYYDK